MANRVENEKETNALNELLKSENSFELISDQLVNDS